MSSSTRQKPVKISPVRKALFYGVLFLIINSVTLLVAEGVVRLSGVAPAIAHIQTEELGLSPNPRLGWYPRPHVLERNNKGFHDDDWERPDPDAFRIVVLGDSVADGKKEWNQTYRQAFPWLLEKKLQDLKRSVQVYNLAVDGYNTMQEVENFRLHGQQLRPHLVLLEYCLNDTLYVAGNALTAMIRMEYYEEYKRNYMMNDLLVWSHLYRIIFLTFFQDDLDEMDVGLDVSRYNILYKDTVQQSLYELKTMAASQGFELLLIIFPNHTAFNRYAPFSYEEGLYPFKKDHLLIENRARNAGIRTIDLLPAVRDCYRKQGSQAVDILHLNPAGHECVASFLSRYLIAEGLVPQDFRN
ncbi:MAG: SGNH/GDSL hydrolase family protein [Leptospiraceae bacterium]|nr:SGNH/GDSL hydrolase family protein [Leptospiraceae bacterium]